MKSLEKLKDRRQRHRPAKVSPWISVKDAHPESYDEVLVTDGSHFAVTYWNPWDEDWADGYSWRIGPITHWHKIVPPEEGFSE